MKYLTFMTKADAQAALKDNKQIEELAKYYQTSQSTITSGLRFLASDGERGCKFEDKRKNSYDLEALEKMAKAGIKPVTPKAEPVKPKVDTKCQQAADILTANGFEVNSSNIKIVMNLQESSRYNLSKQMISDTIKLANKQAKAEQMKQAMLKQIHGVK